MKNAYYCGEYACLCPLTDDTIIKLKEQLKVNSETVIKLARDLINISSLATPSNLENMTIETAKDKLRKIWDISLG